MTVFPDDRPEAVPTHGDAAPHDHRDNAGTEYDVFESPVDDNRNYRPPEPANRLWTCFVIDSWGHDEDDLGHRLYFEDSGMSYWVSEDTWVWSSRADAESVRADIQSCFDDEARKRGRIPMRVYLASWPQS